MSKISKPRDRWSQVFAAATDRAGMCCGCGYYFAVHSAHRADCTTELARRERDRSGRARCDCCGGKAPVETLAWDRYRWQCAACAGRLIGAGNGA